MPDLVPVTLDLPQDSMLTHVPPHLYQVGEWICEYFDDVEAIRGFGDANKETLAELFYRLAEGAQHPSCRPPLPPFPVHRTRRHSPLRCSSISQRAPSHHASQNQISHLHAASSTIYHLCPTNEIKYPTCTQLLRLLCVAA